jgi:DNA-binding NarL/FixJ family response regulator
VSTILIIENHRDTREALTELFREEQFAVVADATLERGLRRLERETPHLVLVDCGRQRDFAHGTSAAIRNFALRAHPAPIGLLATWPLTTQLIDSAGASFSFQKPFNLEVLVATVASVLSSEFPRGAHTEADLAHQYFEALSAKDWDRLGGLCADDVEYHLPAPNQYGQSVRGREAFLAFSRQVFSAFPDARFNNVRVAQLPLGWAARYDGEWTSPDGQRQHLPGGVVFRTSHGRLSCIGVRLNAERLAQMQPAPENVLLSLSE